MAYLKHQIIKFKLLILGMQTDSIYIHLIKWEIILIHLALGKKVNSARDLSRITPFMHFSHAILCHRVILSKESIYIYIYLRQQDWIFISPSFFMWEGGIGLSPEKKQLFFRGSGGIFFYTTIFPYMHKNWKKENELFSESE